LKREDRTLWTSVQRQHKSVRTKWNSLVNWMLDDQTAYLVCDEGSQTGVRKLTQRRMPRVNELFGVFSEGRTEVSLPLNN